MATAHHHGNQAGTLGARVLVWIFNPMLLSQKQLGQTFQRGKVEKGEWRRRRQIPRLKPPQKEGLATELRKPCLDWQNGGRAETRQPSPGLLALLPRSLDRAGVWPEQLAPSPSCLLERLPFHVSQWGVWESIPLENGLEKPLTSSADLPLEMGKLRSAGTRIRKPQQNWTLRAGQQPSSCLE